MLIDFKKYNNDFIWDMNLHFPVPTSNFVLRRTGVVLTRFFDTELEIQGNLVSLVRSAKNYLFYNRTDKEAWEYLVAHDIELLYSVLEYIIEFINFALINGDYLDYFTMKNDKKVSLAIKAAKSNLLGSKKVLLGNVKLYEGY